MIKKEHMSKLLRCVRQIYCHPNSKEFLNQANSKLQIMTDDLNTPIYPMDLATVERNIGQGKYKQFTEFFQDI